MPEFLSGTKFTKSLIINKLKKEEMDIKNLGLEELNSEQSQEVNGGWYVVEWFMGFFEWVMEHSDAIDAGFRDGFQYGK